LAHDKNVIIYNTTGRANQYTPLASKLEADESNYMVLVDDRAHLGAAVARLLRDGVLREKLRARRRQMDPYILFNSDGGALDRAMALIEEAAAFHRTKARGEPCLKTFATSP
jgi:hypothetical protein